MPSPSDRIHVAVIGAGLAGATCARLLSEAGHSVHVFDKSRGAGGRLATRRFEWVEADGESRTVRLDHGAVALTAHSPSFRAAVQEAVHAGWLAEWTPTLAPGSAALVDDGPRHVPVPDMPAWCRDLLGGVPASWSWAVDNLQKTPSGWRVEAGGQRHEALFDAIVLALPPAQAAALLGPHHSDWARRASVALMEPCWTMMGVADAPEELPDLAPAWDLARPPTGVLCWVVRSDTRPGRDRIAGEAHWVVHARAGWSRRHLEQPPAWVQAQMQSALAEWLGRRIDWRHATVHRWRYAAPPSRSAMPVGQCWWTRASAWACAETFLAAPAPKVHGCRPAPFLRRCCLARWFTTTPPKPRRMPDPQRPRFPHERKETP